MAFLLCLLCYSFMLWKYITIASPKNDPEVYARLFPKKMEMGFRSINSWDNPFIPSPLQLSNMGPNQ